MFHLPACTSARHRDDASSNTPPRPHVNGPHRTQPKLAQTKNTRCWCKSLTYPPPADKHKWVARSSANSSATVYHKTADSTSVRVGVVSRDARAAAAHAHWGRQVARTRRGHDRPILLVPHWGYAFKQCHKITLGTLFSMGVGVHCEGGLTKPTS